METGQHSTSSFRMGILPSDSNEPNTSVRHYHSLIAQQLDEFKFSISESFCKEITILKLGLTEVISKEVKSLKSLMQFNTKDIDEKLTIFESKVLTALGTTLTNNSAGPALSECGPNEPNGLDGKSENTIVEVSNILLENEMPCTTESLPSMYIVTNAFEGRGCFTPPKVESETSTSLHPAASYGASPSEFPQEIYVKPPCQPRMYAENVSAQPVEHTDGAEEPCPDTAAASSFMRAILSSTGSARTLLAKEEEAAAIYRPRDLMRKVCGDGQTSGLPSNHYINSRFRKRPIACTRCSSPSTKTPHVRCACSPRMLRGGSRECVLEAYATGERWHAAL